MRCTLIDNFGEEKNIFKIIHVLNPVSGKCKGYKKNIKNFFGSQHLGLGPHLNEENHCKPKSPDTPSEIV